MKMSTIRLRQTSDFAPDLAVIWPYLQIQPKSGSGHISDCTLLYRQPLFKTSESSEHVMT